MRPPNRFCPSGCSLARCSPSAASLAFIVGFAMLGALTFLPTFMQFVDGVSATTSGLRTLPMVAGMLITSIGSGNIVGRTWGIADLPRGRHRDHGSGIRLALRHGCRPPRPWGNSRPTCSCSDRASGWCMQVLVLVVQNTSSFADLGVATSGVTFFRTIGSSFGDVIFGACRQLLLRQPNRACAGGKRSAAARSVESPQARTRLSPSKWQHPSSTLTRTGSSGAFLCAVPVAVVGLIVYRSFSRNIPLREMDAMSATDLGEGSCMPSTESPDKIPRWPSARLMRNNTGDPAGEPSPCGPTADSTSPSCGRCFGSTVISRPSASPGSPTSASSSGIPYEVLEPTFDRLVRGGYAATRRRPVVAHPNWRTARSTSSSSLLQGVDH